MQYRVIKDAWYEGALQREGTVIELAENPCWPEVFALVKNDQVVSETKDEDVATLKKKTAKA